MCIVLYKELFNNGKGIKVRLNYDNADQKIDELTEQGHIVYWRGYDIVLFRYTNLGRYSHEGRLREHDDGTWAWGIETVFKPNQEGEWEVNIPAGRDSKRNRGEHV